LLHIAELLLLLLLVLLANASALLGCIQEPQLQENQLALGF
jgi:hypothetical protein